MQLALATLLVLLALPLACATFSTEPVAPTDQRAGAGITAQIVSPTLTPQVSWDRLCPEIYRNNPNRRGLNTAEMKAYQVSTQQVQETGTDSVDRLPRWRWRFAEHPPSGTAVLGDSEEPTAWLCASPGEWRLDLVAYDGPNITIYRMTVGIP